jgi:hypothetical protein
MGFGRNRSADRLATSSHPSALYDRAANFQRLDWLFPNQQESTSRSGNSKAKNSDHQP